jgi:tRNA threonylcarbamoyladenosine biosynthesis protein TsaE
MTMTEEILRQDKTAVSWEFVTHSEQETFDLGRRIGEKIIEPAVVLLHGELGAGKTVFTKGLAAGLDIDPDEVTSPSFTVINIHEGRLRLYHVDLYRLDSGASEELGLDEIFDQEAVTVIEWAERLRVSPPAVEVNIEYTTGSERRLTISQP